MQCQIRFSWKNKKKYFKMYSADNFIQSAKLWNQYPVRNRRFINPSVAVSLGTLWLKPLACA